MIKLNSDISIQSLSHVRSLMEDEITIPLTARVAAVVVGMYPEAVVVIVWRIGTTNQRPPVQLPVEQITAVVMAEPIALMRLQIMLPIVGMWILQLFTACQQAPQVFRLFEPIRSILVTQEPWACRLTT